MHRLETPAGGHAVDDGDARELHVEHALLQPGDRERALPTVAAGVAGELDGAHLEGAELEGLLRGERRPGGRRHHGLGIGVAAGVGVAGDGRRSREGPPAPLGQGSARAARLHDELVVGGRGQRPEVGPEPGVDLEAEARARRAGLADPDEVAVDGPERGVGREPRDLRAGLADVRERRRRHRGAVHGEGAVGEAVRAGVAAVAEARAGHRVERADASEVLVPGRK